MLKKRTRLVVTVMVVLVVGYWSLLSLKTKATNLALAMMPTNEMQTYHHLPMRLTLSYPADWRLETRDSIPILPEPEYLPEGYSREVDTEGNNTFANNIVLYAPTFKENSLDSVHISIDSIRISPKGDLDTIVQLKYEAIRELVPMTITKQTMTEADDLIVVSAKSQWGQSEEVLLAKDGLIYSIATASTNADVVAMLHEIVAAFKFDGTTKVLSEKYQKYTVDADELRIANEALKAQPQLECDIVCRDLRESQSGLNLKSPASKPVGS